MSTGASSSGRSLVRATSHVSGLHSLTGPCRGTSVAVSHARAPKYQYMTPGIVSKSLDRDRLDTRRWPPSTPSTLVSYGRITFFPVSLGLFLPLALALLSADFSLPCIPRTCYSRAYWSTPSFILNSHRSCTPATVPNFHA